MSKKREEKIVTILNHGTKIKNKRTGEIGIIVEVKEDRCFINYSSYSCGGKIFSVRFRWARITDLLEVEDESK